MHRAEARIATDRAERYLDQLCSHLGAMQHMRHTSKAGHGGAGMPRVTQVEQSPGQAVVRFAEGSWTLSAAADALNLRVEAEGTAELEKLKSAIAARIAKIGRRDRLTVEWHAVEWHAVEWHETDAPAVEDLAHDLQVGQRGRRRLRQAGWIAAIALAAAIHAGLIGSLVGSGRWKELAADAILALLAVKLVLLAAHAKSRRGVSGHR